MSPMLLTPALLAQSDTRLIELARAGHERAFEALVRRYRRELLAHCRRILPADSAEDAVQHGLMGAWTALQNGTEVRGARAWLHRVVHNAALRSLAIAGGHAELTDVQLGTDGPEEQLIRREDLRDTLHALASLPELQREALVLTTVEGQSYESVAEMLGLSQTSLRGLIYRARASMRAAASAVVPLPLLSGLLARGRQASAAARLTAASSAGAPAALGGLLTKGGAVVLAVGAAAGGVGVAHLVANRASHHPAPHRVTRPQNSGRSGAVSAAESGSAAARRGPAVSELVLALHRSAAVRPAGSEDHRRSGAGANGSDNSNGDRSGASAGSPGGPGPSSGSGSGSGSSGAAGSGDGGGSSSSGAGGSSGGSGGSGDGGGQATIAQATTADGGGSGSGGGGDSTSGGQTGTDTQSTGGGGTSDGGGSTSTADTSTSTTSSDGGGGGSGSGG